MFPPPDQLGIDLVLPDFAYLRERADDIEAIVLTHGHEDHVGALPFVLRELGRDAPPIYGGPLTLAMARSKLDEHKLKDVERSRTCAPGDAFDAGPFDVELINMAHSIPDACAVALTCELGTMLITGDYKFDQTPVDGDPADVVAPGRARPRGRAAALRRLDQRRPRRASRRRSRASGPQLEEMFARCEGRIVVTELRLQHPPRAAGRRRRRRARTARSRWSAARCARTSTSAARSGHIEVPEGMLVPPREIEDFPDHKLVIISTGSQGEPLSALRRMAHGDHPQVELHAGDTVDLLGHADPGQRARGQRDDRPPLPASAPT